MKLPSFKTRRKKRFVRYCKTQVKFSDADIEKLFKLVDLNGGKVTDGMVRGYFPLSWATCVSIIQEMEACGLVEHVEHLPSKAVHLPPEDRKGWWEGSTF